MPKFRKVKCSLIYCNIALWLAMLSTFSCLFSCGVGNLMHQSWWDNIPSFTPNFITIFSTMSISFTLFALSPFWSFCKTNSCTSFSSNSYLFPNIGSMWFSKIRAYAEYVELFTYLRLSSFHIMVISLIVFFAVMLSWFK